ncbi:hypothetical protein BHM03_00006651 [Ensete ventricosum]|nr:hypothetical protein BHM03_00006651 [Ensete ventricosum]
MVPPCAGAAPAGAVALTGGCPGRGAAPCGLAVGAAPARSFGRGRPPLARSLGRSRLPLVVGLTVGSRPCMGTGSGWPPLLAAFAAKMQQ